MVLIRMLGVLVLGGLLHAPALHAQPRDASGRATLTGTVTDAETGAPLPGAALYALPAGRGATVDSTGAYRLPLPTGRTTLSVSYLGYRPRTLTLDLQFDRTLNIALVPRPLDLDELEVTADRAERSVESTQMSAIELPVAELEELPALLGEVDVLKTIQLLPGVQSGTEGTTGLYVRGGGPDQNLILLDGAPVYNPNHIFGFLSVFNSDALENVRLVKGGFPARYGGRLSSVVDITMKEGGERYRTEGSVGLVASSLTVEGPVLGDKASFIVSGRRTYIDVLARPFIRRQLPDGQGLTAYFYDLNGKLSYAPTEADRFSLSLYGGSDVYGTRDETVVRDDAGQAARRDRYAAGSDWGNRVATLRWQHRFSDQLTFMATLLHSGYRFGISTRLTQIDERSDPPETFEEITYTSGIRDYGGKLDFEFRPAPAHHVRFGGRLVRHFFNPGVARLDLQLGGDGDLDTTLTPTTYRFSGLEGALYMEDDVRITSRLKANAGLHAAATRVEGRTYTSLQPRLSLRYLLRPNWSAKASFATMEQYLHLLTNTGINLPTDLWLAATDRVGPQRAWQAALGTTLALADDAVEVSVEGYYKDMRGLIEYEPGASFAAPNEEWQEKVTIGRGWAYGAELFVRKKRGRATGWVGYTLAWSRRRFEALNGGTAFPYRYDRRHDLALVLAYELTDRLDVSGTWVYGTGQAVTLAEARFLDGRFDPRLFGGGGAAFQPELRAYGPRGGYRMAPYHRLDVALNWHFDAAFFSDAGESTLVIGAYNVYSRQNPFYLFEARGPDGHRQYRQASLFPVLPALSYRFRF